MFTEWLVVFVAIQDEQNRYTGLESIPTGYHLTGSPSNYYVPDSYRSLDNMSNQCSSMNYQMMPQSTCSVYPNQAPEPSEHGYDAPEEPNLTPPYEHED